MKFFFSETQMLHQPTQYMVHGKLIQAFENPDRATTLIRSMQSAGLTLVEPPAADLAPILAVHADHYLEFLRVAHADFMALPNHGPEVLPNVHPYRAADAAFTPRGKPGPQLPADQGLAAGCRHGLNDYTGWFAGDAQMGGDYFGYDGPYPPFNDLRMHRYFFRLFALDVAALDLPVRFTAGDVLQAMKGHVLAEALVYGTYTLNPSLRG